MDTGQFLEFVTETLWADEGYPGIQRLHDLIHDKFGLKDQKQSHGVRKKDAEAQARRAALLAYLRTLPRRDVHVSEMGLAVSFKNDQQRYNDLIALTKTGEVVFVRSGYWRLS